MKIEVNKTNFKDLNERIRELVKTEDHIELNNVFGQRYIGCTIQAGKKITINGTPGNDMCAYMCGAEVEVFGSCQEATGNTMDGGKVIVHGNSGDALGYGMRDGEIYIKGDTACRGGIHMKEFKDKKAVIVVGGSAGDFFGEYMAGGIIILLGYTGDNEEIVGRHTLCGMHGGKMIVRGEIKETHLSDNVKKCELDETDKKDLENYVSNYCDHFGFDKEEILNHEFSKYVPLSKSPYAKLYTPN